METSVGNKNHLSQMLWYSECNICRGVREDKGVNVQIKACGAATLLSLGVEHITASST